MGRQSPPVIPAKAPDEPGLAAGFASLCEEIDQLFDNLALRDRITNIHKAPAGRALTFPLEIKETPGQSGHRIISQRSYGIFRRRFSLPPDVDPARIDARYRLGVLMVTIGKDAAARGRVHAIAVT